MWLLAIATIVVAIVSCGVIENSLEDIEGWDFSACVDSPDVCLELISDNKDKFNG